MGAASLIVPERAIDAQSLIAFADLVVSAGGTMNREAVALGTPVYTTFAGRMGGSTRADRRAAGCVSSPTRPSSSCESARRRAGRVTARPGAAVQGALGAVE